MLAVWLIGKNGFYTIDKPTAVFNNPASQPVYNANLSALETGPIRERDAERIYHRADDAQNRATALP